MVFFTKIKPMKRKTTVKIGIALGAALLGSILFSSSAPPADKLFSLLSSKETGIKFNNKLKDTKEHNIMIYSNFYGGAGVGIGDVNNDGLADIYFAGNQVSDRLYLNKGGMKFQDITKQAGILDDGGWSSGVVFGDVNQDGLTDIYVCRELYDDQPDLRKNKLYINQGNNKFEESAEAFGLANSERTRGATFLDYDKDGDLDLFLLNQPPNPGDYSPFYNTELLLDEYSPRLMENQGAKFVDVTEKAGLLKAGFPNGVSASDINGDGWTDLYIANDFWVPDFVYVNNGDGTFSNKADEALKHMSYFSMGVDAGDMNNDGLLDLMVVDMVAEDNYRLKANMSGMNPDKFWKVVEEGGHYQYMFNTLQVNNGDLSFSDIAHLGGIATTDWSWTNLFADLDNDGWKDIYVTNGLLRDIRNSDATKKVAKAIETRIAEYLKKNPNPQGISIWDLVDINKVLGLVPSEKLQNYAFQNKGNLSFEKKMEDWGLDHKTFSNGAAYADLDNDGDLDLILNNVNEEAFIYQNNSEALSGHHYLRVELINDAEGVAKMGSKIWVKTAEGKQLIELTSARGIYSCSEDLAHFGLGENTKIESLEVEWPDGKVNRINNPKVDQTLKVLYSKAKKPRRGNGINMIKPLFHNRTKDLSLACQHKENDFDDFEKQVLLPHKMSNYGPSLAVGDVNGDGLDDFFLGGAVASSGQLMLQQLDGTYSPAVISAFNRDALHEDVGASFFDADNDGDLDLYVVSGGNEFDVEAAAYQDRLYLNDGRGQFDKAKDWLPDMKFSGSKVVPEDFDQDGDIDLLVTGRHIPWAYPEPATSVLLRNEGNQFINVNETLAPDLIDVGMINDARWVDLDGDQQKEIVLVGEWTPITILGWENGAFKDKTEAYGLAESTGWWYSVEAADIDNDGDMDLVAGNLGLNYKYRATAEEPFEVFYYDFDNSGSKDVVLAYYNFGKQFPLRGRACSSQQIPAIKEKFKTYDLFASADITTVYQDEKLQQALHLQAQTFASVYLENKGNGQFQLTPLPQAAQWSSINDILIEDFNEDGKQDLLMAGNLYSAEVETPRNDAGIGVLLLGDGKGNFEPLSKAESGFYVPYDVKNLAKLNKQAVLVGCNNAALQIFQWGESVQK